MNNKYIGLTPKEITPAVLAFAMLHGNPPQYVGRDDRWVQCRFGHCYENCEIVQHCIGGELVLGYTIWQTRDLFLSSEHHCVLRRNDALIDVTPDPSQCKTVLFVPTEIPATAKNISNIIETGQNGRFMRLHDHVLLKQAMELMSVESQIELVRATRGYPDLGRWNSVCDEIDDLLDKFCRLRIKKAKPRRDKMRRGKVRLSNPKDFKSAWGGMADSPDRRIETYDVFDNKERVA